MDDIPNATETSTLDNYHGPPGPPSHSIGSSPSESSSESDATARNNSATPTSLKEGLEKADRIKVIRPAKSRFKTPLDYRTYVFFRC